MLYLDGKPEKVYKRPLTGRIFGVCLTFTIILCITMGAIGFLVFQRSMMKQYEMNLCDIIELTGMRIDAEDLERCYETGERSEKFNELSVFLDEIRESYSLDHIALTRPVKEGDKYDVIQLVSGLTEEEKKGGTAGGAPIPYLGDRIGAYFPEALLPGIYNELLYSRSIEFMTTKTDYGNTYRGATTILKEDGTPVALLTAGLSLEFIEDTKAQYLSIAMLASVVLGLVFITIMILWLRKRVINPLSMIENAASEFEEKSRYEKDPNVFVMNLPEIHTGDELESLSEALSTMSLRMKNYVEELMKSAQTVDNLRQDLAVSKRQAMQFSELAVKDALTGIRNKAGYDKEVEKLVKDFDMGNTKFGVAMVDLNDLKKINDGYGHDKGNVAIKKLCSIVCTVFEHSPVFRIGGDEFAVILKGYDYVNVSELVEKFNAEIEKISNDESLEPWNKASAAIGYAIYTRGLDFCFEDVFKRADEAMYIRKNEMKATRE